MTFDQNKGGKNLQSACISASLLKTQRQCAIRPREQSIVVVSSTESSRQLDHRWYRQSPVVIFLLISVSALFCLSLCVQKA